MKRTNGPKRYAVQYQHDDTWVTWIAFRTRRAAERDMATAAARYPSILLDRHGRRLAEARA